MIELKGYLGLILVKIIGSDVSDGLDVAVFHCESRLIILVGLIKVVELIVNAADSDLQFRFIGMDFLSVFKDINCSFHVIFFLVYFAEIKVGVDIVIVLE